MKKKVTWIVVSVFMVLALLAVSCAPAPEEKAPAPEAPAAPAAPAAPVAPAAPAVKEAAPVETEGMAKDSFGKLVEKPRYGGWVTGFRTSDELYWNGDRMNWATPPYEMLLQNDWAKGPAGTGDWDGVYPEPIAFDQMTGMLAESWGISDPITMVFHIRKGVHWQNKAPAFGREMDAYDVEFALRRAWTFPSAYVNRNYPASENLLDGSAEKGINATDKWTVVIKTQPGMLGSVYEMGVSSMFSGIYPPEILKYDMNDWRNAGGTGPFIVTDVVPSSSYTYVKNPDYWMKDPLHPENQLPYLDGFRRLIIPDVSTRMAAIRTGKLDLLGGTSISAGALTWEDAASLKKTNPELGFKFFMMAGPPGLYMRMDKPELPYKDIRVRRALAMAIDNKAICNDFYGGHADMFGWPVLRSIKAYADAYTPLEEYSESVQKMFGYYPEEAKKLLADAGYPNGFMAVVNCQAGDVDMLSIVADYWKTNLNVELDIQVVTPAVHSVMTLKHTHAEMFVTATNNTLFKIVTVRVERDDRNHSRFTDRYGDDLFYEGMKLYFDNDAKIKLFKEKIPYFLEQAWFIVFPTPEIVTVWQPWLKNYYGVNYTGYYVGGDKQDFMKYVWLDQDMKKR